MPKTWAIIVLMRLDFLSANTTQVSTAHANTAHPVLPNNLGWQNAAGNVLGIYLHGLFEDPQVLQALFGQRCPGQIPTLDTVFDGLADYLRTHFAPGVLEGLVRLTTSPSFPA